MTPNDHLDMAESWAREAALSLTKRNYESAQVKADLAQAEALMALVRIQQLANRMNGGTK